MKKININEIKNLDKAWGGDFDGGEMIGVDIALKKENLVRFAVDKESNSIIVLDLEELQQIVNLVNSKEIIKLLENNEPIKMFEEVDSFGDKIYPAIEKITHIPYENLYINSFDCVIDKILQDNIYSKHSVMREDELLENGVYLNKEFQDRINLLTSEFKIGRHEIFNEKKNIAKVKVLKEKFVVSLELFGVKDVFKPIQEYIKDIKNSYEYKDFILKKEIPLEKAHQKEKFIIANAKTNTEYIKEFESGMECKNWIINNLDMSLNWEMVSVENLYQEHKEYCKKYNLEQTFVCTEDITNTKNAIWEIKERAIEKEKIAHFLIVDGDEIKLPKSIKEIENILYNDKKILLIDEKNDKFIEIEENYNSELIYKIFDSTITKINEYGKINRNSEVPLCQNKGVIKVEESTGDFPVDSIDTILLNVEKFVEAEKETSLHKLLQSYDAKEEEDSKEDEKAPKNKARRDR